MNRLRPQLQCNGKCYLMKKLREAEENEKKQDQEDILKNLELTFIIKPLQVSFYEAFEIKLIKETLSDYYSFYCGKYISRIFHPPQLLHFLLRKDFLVI